MKMKEITNGSLYRYEKTQDIVRVRNTLNTSSVTVCVSAQLAVLKIKTNHNVNINCFIINPFSIVTCISISYYNEIVKFFYILER